jgi:hypothetical protein
MKVISLMSFISIVLNITCDIKVYEHIRSIWDDKNYTRVLMILLMMILYLKL